MARIAKYPLNCPQCLVSDRVIRKGLYPAAGDGFYRLVCRRCNVSFTRCIPELATGAIAPDRPAHIPNRGEQHPQAKLTEKQVRDIVALSDSGSSAIELADRYQVAKATITSILYGVTWSSVTGLIPKTQKLPPRYRKRGR